MNLEGKTYFKVIFFFLSQDGGKAKALSRVDGIRTVVPTVVSDSLQSHENLSPLLRKQTLDDFCLKHVKENTAWHFTSAAVRAQDKQQEGEFVLKQQGSVCLRGWCKCL